ncbi:DUF6850 family outer membrane beta-barrel protein [Sphingobacterium spiritivorum]|uniref:DUF6850 family outer membrane beta-barrel protein n=1 Tax=Sphingobacterium spiritivorum TaxID=258 RepID=UPI003DA5640D
MKKNLFASLCVLTLMGQMVSAQTVPAYDYFKAKEVWSKSPNAALLRYTILPAEGETQLGAYYQAGDLRHPFSAKESQGINFSTSRYQRLKEWTYYGQFDFRTTKDKQMNMTAHTDPYRDNPYQLMDSLSGDWKKQHYDLRLKIASPGFADDRMNAGLDVQYNLKTGARQKDPRSLDNSSTLNLSPALIYKLSERQLLGLTGIYNFYKEEVEIRTIGNYQQHYLYRLLGAGEYQMSIPYIMIAGYNRTYRGHSFGGAVDYVYNADHIKWSTTAGYRSGYENAIDGTTYLQQAGKHRYQQYQASSYLDWKKGKYAHQVGLEWLLKDMENTEYHQIQNADTKVYETVYSSVMSTMLRNKSTLSYLISHDSRAGLTDWWLKTAVSYHSLDNRYANPQNKQIVDKLNVAVSFDKTYAKENRKGFAFQLSSAYDLLLSDELLYTDKSYSTNFVAKNVFIPAHQFYSVNTWTNSANVKYTFGAFGKKSNQLYIKASGWLMSAMGDQGDIRKGDNRYLTQLSVGLISL